jgi:GTP-binding protein HflX
VADAHLVLHVVDGSHPEPEAQLASVREVLAEVGAGEIRKVVVINKADAADPAAWFPGPTGRARCCPPSTPSRAPC